jgi:myo-inositol-1(or 4)-monophosphatase
MNLAEQQRALDCAVKAARTAGRLMRQHLSSIKAITQSTQHDIKLELDVRCQKLIEKVLLRAFPDVAVLGEEGVAGDPYSDHRWVVDPIDGTVNFTYGIPHACVSIALQVQRSRVKVHRSKSSDDDYATLMGVVYEPFSDEMWTAIRGQTARLNGRIIRVSNRRHLTESIVALGFAKGRSSLNQMLPVFNRLIRRVRKIRIMGAAALSLTYVASGRMDAYLEYGIRLWDIAAGGLILECAGGDFWREPVAGKHAYQIIANNGLLRQKVRALM